MRGRDGEGEKSFPSNSVLWRLNAEDKLVTAMQCWDTVHAQPPTPVKLWQRASWVLLTQSEHSLLWSPQLPTASLARHVLDCQWSQIFLFSLQEAWEQPLFLMGIGDITVSSGLSYFPLFCAHKLQVTGSIYRLRGSSSLTEKCLRIKMEVRMPFFNTTKYAVRDACTRHPCRKASCLALYPPCGCLRSCWYEKNGLPDSFARLVHHFYA